MKRLINPTKHEENAKQIRLSLVDYRCYGDAKLKKPKELKGLKPVKRFDLNGKRVDVYDIGNGSLVLYFGTLFSRLATFPEVEDMQLPSSALAKKYGLQNKSYKGFIYPDAWCKMYNRNEGYVLIERIGRCFEDLCGLHIYPIIDKVYYGLREQSTQDERFAVLPYIATDDEGAAYFRLCCDLVEWMYNEERNRK